METQHTESQALEPSLEPNLSIANEPRRPVDETRVAIAIEMLLDALGEDCEREGLQETSHRVARFYKEFIDYDAGNLGTVFETQAYGQLIVVAGIEVTSLCEHHLLPFSCTVSIAYYPAKHILGLSKFARVAHAAAHRLNTQERLTRIIRDTLSELTGAHSILVMTSNSKHACMSMRGIEESCATTTIVDSTGLFYSDAAQRDYALRMIQTSYKESDIMNAKQNET